MGKARKATGFLRVSKTQGLELTFPFSVICVRILLEHALKFLEFIYAYQDFFIVQASRKIIFRPCFKKRVGTVTYRSICCCFLVDRYIRTLKIIFLHLQTVCNSREKILICMGYTCPLPDGMAVRWTSATIPDKQRS